MDIATFYYSQLRKWMFCSVGILAIVFGLVNLVTYVINVDSQWFATTVLHAFAFILFGILIILIAWEHKKTAFYLSLLLICAFFLHVIFFLFFRDLTINKVLVQMLTRQETTPFANKTLVIDSLFLLLVFALLCHTLPNVKQIHIWISGICACAAFVIASYFVSFNLTEVKLFPFNIHLNTTAALFGILISLVILGYSGTRLAYLYPSSGVLWLPIFATIAAIFLTLTTWMTYGAREKELIAKNNAEKATLLKEQIEDRAQLYFSSLTRMKNRWAELGLPSLQKNFLQVESDTFLTFPWLKEFGLVTADHKIIDLKSAENTPSLINIFPLVETHVSQKNSSADLHIFFANSPKDQSPILIAYAPLHSKTVPEKTYFFSEANAREFFAKAVQDYLEKESAILISNENGMLYSSNTEEVQYKANFSTREKFDFFGNSIVLEQWPLPKYIGAFRLPVSYYQLIIGLIFSFTLFWALYLAQIAMRKKKEADKANREKTMFLANMSHEIRTPLHGIIGSCSLLALSKLDEYQKKWVEGINKSGKILLDLLDELLDMSKIEANAITLELHTIHLKPLVAEVIELLTPKAQSKNIDLQLDYSSSVEEQFLLDGKRIRQIIINLVSNGIRFTQAGFVKLSVLQSQEAKDPILILRVEDSGIGISKERLNNIFKTYLSIDIRTEKGSGLGLAITKRLVELMGGKIEVESHVDKGTIFTVKIPVKRGESDG